MMNLTNITTSVNFPPSQLTFDYVQISYLSVMVVVGVPVNLYSIWKTSCNNRPNYKMNIIDILKLHLASTDIMILCFFAVSKIFWLSTYQWMGGDFLCKLVQFLISFSFCLCSNLVCSVALIRWTIVRNMNTPSLKRCKRKFRIFVYVSYALAFLFSLPLMLFWFVVYPFPEYPDWGQCVTKFGFYVFQRMKNINLPFEVVYNIFHTLVIFWIPFTLIVVCYLRVYCLLKKNIRTVRHRADNDQNNHYHTLEDFRSRHNSSNLTPHSPMSTDGIPSQITSSNTTIQIDSNSNININISETTPLNAFSLTTLSRAKNKFVKETSCIIVAYVSFWLCYNLVTLLQEMGIDTGFIYWRALYSLIVFNAVLNPFLYGI